MHQEHRTVIEQVRTSAAPLSNAERLTLIRAIASLETPNARRRRAETLTDRRLMPSKKPGSPVRLPSDSNTQANTSQCKAGRSWITTRTNERSICGFVRSSGVGGC